MARGIDHLVIALQDLDAGARLYERLGFQVGALNRHPWGTQNRIVQFDGAFLELISLAPGGAPPDHAPGAFSFGGFVRDYLARREGLAMLVLDSADAGADAQAFAAAGIGAFAPFRFERIARRPDGTEKPVAFALAFAASDALPAAGFFVCQQLHPENFWDPAFQNHPNGARGVGAVALAADEPARHAEFLSAFAGAEATRPTAGGDLSFALARGRLDVVTPDDAATLYVSVETADAPCLAAFTIDVDDVERTARRLAGAVPHQRIGSRLVVPASVAHGVAIAFETVAPGLDGA
jgi:hypothetical protein